MRSKETIVVADSKEEATHAMVEYMKIYNRKRCTFFFDGTTYQVSKGKKGYKVQYGLILALKPWKQ